MPIDCAAAEFLSQSASSDAPASRAVLLMSSPIASINAATSFRALNIPTVKPIGFAPNTPTSFATVPPIAANPPKPLPKTRIAVTVEIAKWVISFSIFPIPSPTLWNCTPFLDVPNNAPATSTKAGVKPLTS